MRESYLSEEPKSYAEYAIDFYNAHKFAIGFLVGLILYRPLFYIVIGFYFIYLILSLL